MKEPYKAYRDDALLTKLEALNTAYIHLDDVDEYGALEITITSCEESEDKIDAIINDDGLQIEDMPCDRFALRASTLRQLVAMSAAYAAGYAAARQLYTADYAAACKIQSEGKKEP